MRLEPVDLHRSVAQPEANRTFGAEPRPKMRQAGDLIPITRFGSSTRLNIWNIGINLKFNLLVLKQGYLMTSRYLHCHLRA